MIFCVGGRGASGDPFKTIECYDLRKDRWFPVAEMSSRRRHVGVVSVNGNIICLLCITNQYRSVCIVNADS